jgi:phage gp16-like protein
MPEQATPVTQPPASPVQLRELFLKYFQAKPGEKPLSEKEFEQIKPHLDRRMGGLTKETYELFKGDKDIVKAASISQVHRDHRIMNARAAEIRDTLLKALNAKPGEKPLTAQEFKDVAIFLDRKNGGLRHHAYEIFKEDKEICAAAEKHRNAWRETAKGRAADPGKETGRNAATVNQSKETTKSSPPSNRGKDAQPQEPARSEQAMEGKPAKAPSKLRQFIQKRSIRPTAASKGQGLEPGGD